MYNIVKKQNIKFIHVNVIKHMEVSEPKWVISLWKATNMMKIHEIVNSFQFEL